MESYASQLFRSKFGILALCIKFVVCPMGKVFSPLGAAVECI